MNNNNATATSSFRRYRQVSAEISVALKEMKIDRQFNFSLYYLNAGDDLCLSNLYYCDTFMTMRELEARVIENFQGDPKLNGSYIATINSQWLAIYDNNNNKITAKTI